MSDEPIAFREPTREQRRLLAALLARSPWEITPGGWLDRVRVAAMDDGGMGSFRIAAPGAAEESRAFGSEGAELAFQDADGTPVLVTLYLDRDGAPFEVDVWRVDFSPVVRIPDAFPDP
jgi:hypothetical protein